MESIAVELKWNSMMFTPTKIWNS